MATMNDPTPAPMTSDDLRRLGRLARPGDACPACGEWVCPGWESLPVSFERSRLRRVGTLRRGGDEEPTVEEHHPDGTHGWSVDAPIAPAFFPYNRCEVWQCVTCERAFLRYTEYGGYYEDERIRALDPDLVVDVS